MSSGKNSSLSKELQQMARTLRDQGWTVEATSKSHMRWVPPGGGEYYVSSSSPSSQRTIVNIKKDLETRGAVWDKSEYRRQSNAVKSIQTALDNHRAEVTEAYRILNLAWNKDLYGGSPADLDPVMALVLVQFTSGTSLKPSLDLRCPCRKQFFYPLAFYNHLLTCSKVNVEMNVNPGKEAITVDRDMTVPPPERERLNCSDCDYYSWITQPWLLEKHYAAEHGKVPCPYCGKFFSKNRGGLTKHIAACNERPDPMLANLGDEPPTIEVLDPADPEHRRHFVKRVTPTSHPEWFPAPPVVPALGDYDYKPCIECGQPLGQDRGGSSVCWNPICWEKINNFFTERGDDAMAAAEDYLTGQTEWIISRIGADEYAKAQERERWREAKRRSRERRREQAESRSADLDEPGGPPSAEHESPEPDEAPPSARSPEPEPDISTPTAAPLEEGTSALEPADSTRPTVPMDDDDTLWALLEIVLDGPVMMNRETMTAVNEWMEITRRLMHLKAAQS